MRAFLAAAFLVFFMATCRADDMIQAQTIQQEHGAYSTGADTMVLLSKLFKAPALNDTRTARQRPSLVRDSITSAKED